MAIKVLKKLILKLKEVKNRFCRAKRRRKTTLAKIIAGVIGFNSGERILGHNTIVSYYAQDVADNLDPDLDIIETVDGIAEDKTIGQLRSLLGSFLFQAMMFLKRLVCFPAVRKAELHFAKFF